MVLLTTIVNASQSQSSLIAKGKDQELQAKLSIVLHREVWLGFENLFIKDDGEVLLVKGSDQTIESWGKGKLDNLQTKQIQQALARIDLPALPPRYFLNEEQGLIPEHDWFELIVIKQDKEYYLYGQALAAPEQLQNFLTDISKLAANASKPIKELPSLGLRAIPLIDYFRIPREDPQAEKKFLAKIAKLKADQVDFYNFSPEEMNKFRSLKQAISTPRVIVPLDARERLTERVKNEQLPFIHTAEGYFALKFYRAKKN